MVINDDVRLSEIKAAFSNQFPGLRIEFYSKAHKDHQGSPKDALLNENLSVGDIREEEYKSGELHLSDDLTVTAVERLFENKFGLHIQIFRRSNNLWLQTTATDHWTLGVQNGKGVRSVQDA